MKCLLYAFALLVTIAISFPASAQLQSSEIQIASSPSASSAVQQSGLHDRARRYRLRSGDSFDLQFAFSPEFNQTIMIQPDGYVTLKSIGSMMAENLTIPELTQDITKAYSGILHEPVVTIDLRNFEMPYFVVAGQVGKPGKYDLRSDLTVTEGVAIAGGFTSASKHSQVVLFRPGTNGITEARVINVKKLLLHRDLSEDIHLSPGDFIYVPQNRISKIDRYLPTSSLGVYGYPQSF